MFTREWGLKWPISREYRSVLNYLGPGKPRDAVGGAADREGMEPARPRYRLLWQLHDRADGGRCFRRSDVEVLAHVL